MSLSPIAVLLLVLAVYRLTVILTKDYIAEPIRRFMRGSRSHHLYYLSSCPWCCSVWVAAVLVPLTALVSWWIWVDTVFACSACAAVLFERVNE